MDFYPSEISNKRKTNIKDLFLEIVKMYEENNLIEKKYAVLYQGKICSAAELTRINISEVFVLFEKLEEIKSIE